MCCDQGYLGAWMRSCWTLPKFRTTCITVMTSLYVLSLLLTSFPHAIHGQCATASGNNTTIKMQIATIIPVDNNRLFSIEKVRPSMDVAIQYVRDQCLLPEWLELEVMYNDSHCNAKDAPVAAFSFYMERKVDVFIGPVCDYSLAPVARYAPYWNLPVITPGGLAHDFGFNKSVGDPEFPTLTRVGATFNSLANAIINITKYYNWSRIKAIYAGEGHNEVTPRFCFLAISALIHYVKTYRAYEDHDFHIYIPGGDAGTEKLLRDEVGNDYSGK